ncbi:multiple monosaccharide ABC transporter substrate-binding protein [Streptomyces rishiriensis]|uniref:Multiple sugar transport system substrate-binding protein n=1 Tax=Streptomyces rishiriensis TaxID=68264 RepID=A0ABU0NPY6_STRRH|nr:multiple monosaccharide ABC transporter substrate-binding protein [Streptomyces rishiriensis]MDQ0580793.1 putative multiple sugar transport system substrate-binding protein [Streptomyces rishiriensis]
MRNRRAALAAIAGAASLALTLSACGQSGDGGSKDEGSDSAKGGTIGIAMPTKSSERWISDGANVVKDLEAKGYKTKLVYGEDDPDQQVSQIENLITQGVKALIVAAIDNKSLNNVLQQAADAKIPVISYDRLILGTKNVDYYASFDNSKVGELQANYIVDKLGLKSGKGPFNIELFAGSNDDNNTKYFFNGAMSVLQPYIDSKKLVVQSGQTGLTQVTTLRWDGATAQKRMDDILTKSYGSKKVDAVLSPYDGISIGILSALKSDDYGSASKPLPVLTGQDAELASVKSIIAGGQTQTVYKDLRELAKVATTMVDDVLNGKTPETNDTKTYDNGTKVVPAYLLQPVSVDKTNYEKVLVEGGYYTADQLK